MPRRNLDEAYNRLGAALRAHHEAIAQGLTAYGQMTSEEREAATALVMQRTGSRVVRVSEIMAAHEELQTRAMGAQVICKVQEAA